MPNARRLRTAAIGVALTAALVSPSAPAGAGHSTGPYFDLGKLPAPTLQGKELNDGVKTFSEAYPMRVTGTPNEILAGVDIRDQLKALGYEARIQSFPVDHEAIATNTPGVALKAVTGMKRGTTRPDEWIIFTSHYDTLPTTINGAYDNATGPALMLSLAKQLKSVPTNRSLVFAFFNGEEEGVLASSRYAQAIKDAGQKVTAVLGFDMVGAVSYPVKTPGATNCLCMWYGPTTGAAAFAPMLKHVSHTFLGFPEATNLVKVVGVNNRNSDEQSFHKAAIGYPTIRWAGMKSASNYPHYHKDTDTFANMNAVAGGEEFAQAGMKNTFDIVYYTVLTLDNHLPEAAFTSSTSGRTVSVDAATTTDADAAVTGYTWDFGDGSTGTGVTASHTYAAPGTYTVTLTAADNLWSQVTRTATTTITV